MPQDLKKWAPQAQALRKGPYTVEASGAQKVEGETLPRRNVIAKDQLKMTPTSEVQTMYDVLRYSSQKYGNAKAVGARRIVNKINETKKVKKMVDGKETEVDKNWEFYELSGYSYKSFVEFEKMALSVGSALHKLGFKPEDRLHLFAATSMQWLASAHGRHLEMVELQHLLTMTLQAPSHSPLPSSPHTTRSARRASSTPCPRPTPRSCSQTQSCCPSSSTR
jgi:long-chain acyl-CoA synthetase